MAEPGFVTAPTSGTAARSAADSKDAPSVKERLEYGASGFRQAFFAVVFLLLIPFFVSLPVMLYNRIYDRLWFDTWQLVLFALLFAGLMAMLALELLYAIRARLTFGKSALRFTLPVGLGPTPLLRYQSHDIPYHTIKSVELRREVFAAPVIPILMQGAVVHTKDNRSIPLGYSREAHHDGAFPFATIAAQIAKRAAVPLAEHRAIWRRPRKERALAFISEIDTQNYIVDPGEAEKINKAHRRLVLALASILATLLLLGLWSDLMSG